MPQMAFKYTRKHLSGELAALAGQVIERCSYREGGGGKNTIAAEFGTSKQQAAWLPGLIDGRIRSGFAVTEPTTGLETLKLRTRAERREGGWLINGQKVRGVLCSYHAWLGWLSSFERACTA
jgi:alkylation response protein AidB-like acyl-CoA dehydrogenase